MSKRFNPKRTAFSAIFLLLLFGYMLTRKPPSEPHPKFVGQAFGPIAFKVYTAEAHLDQPAKSELVAQMKATVDAVNQTMSTWRDDSQIVRFNQTNSTDWIEVSDDFAKVMQAALLIAQETDGAFDPTAGVRKRNYNLGPDAGDPATPPIGYRLVEQLGARIRKSDPAVQLDLDAIAKGYAIDEISDVLTQRGITNHLVEIGGEVRTSGKRPDGTTWPVYIQQPIPQGDIHTELVRANVSVATSGTAYQANHFIDPASGKSVTNTLRSVSVRAPTCIEADALATAYMVMGRERASAHVEARPDTEALFLYVKEGVLEDQASSGW